MGYLVDSSLWCWWFFFLYQKLIQNKKIFFHNLLS